MSVNPFILLLAKSNPAVYEVVFPHGPKFSKGAIDVFASQIVKSISLSVNKEPASKALGGLAKQLYSLGIGSMDFDMDNFCGTPYPIHHINAEPDPDPWFVGHLSKHEKQMTINYYGGIVSIVSQVVSDKKIAGQLAEIANEMMSQKG